MTDLEQQTIDAQDAEEASEIVKAENTEEASEAVEAPQPEKEHAKRVQIYDWRKEEKTRPDLEEFSKQKDIQTAFRSQMIAIKFELYKSDIAGFNSPTPYYAMLNLMWSPYFLIGEVEEFFEPFAQKATKADQWLEINGHPISW